MSVRIRFLNSVVAAFLSFLLTCGVALALDQEKLDDLFTRLQAAGAEEAGRIETEIWIEWSKSGSPAIDLLLQRGRDALAIGDTTTAIEHFTAIIDHSPEFAEGWNARATAYYAAGEFGPALADIAATLERNPQHFGALAGLAAILEGTDHPERALKVYQAALAIHPHLEGVANAIERLETAATGQEL